MGLVIYRVATDLAAKLAFFLITIVAARQFSRESFGLFSLATTVGWITAVAADFGLQIHLARAVAQSPPRAAVLLRRWGRVRVTTAAVAVVAIATGAPLVSASGDTAATLVLFTALYAVNGLTEFLYYFFRGLGRSDLESTIVLGQRTAMLILGLAVLRFAPGLFTLGAALLVPAVGALAIASAAARRLAGSRQQQTATTPPAADALADVLAIGAGIVLSALYFRIDIFMIDGWLGSEAVGDYNAVFRLVEALRLAPAAVVAVAMPALFRATSRAPLWRVSSLLVAGAIPLAAALWLIADPLIALTYGASYRVAAPVLRLLVLSFPLMALNYALTHQLIGWHGHRLYAAVCAIALVVNVVANAILIPATGLAGAAWATLITEAVVTLGCLVGIGLASTSQQLCHPPASRPLVTP